MTLVAPGQRVFVRFFVLVARVLLARIVIVMQQTVAGSRDRIASRAVVHPAVPGAADEAVAAVSTRGHTPLRGTQSRTGREALGAERDWVPVRRRINRQTRFLRLSRRLPMPERSVRGAIAVLLALVGGRLLL